ncbi:hypothetical protein CAC42_1719 [Sphaceloma murrayae]|uniref:C2H2-type domain-containing protein n=1 Tax=Sphaceloma murrayae TaxID=2082308 RepID=A0A2K1QHS3_9PEZI|nr:hypothetical protein CAC42_1719 [Sphaceloma murrayae]
MHGTVTTTDLVADRAPPLSNGREVRHPHACLHCSRHFKRAEHLKRHQRTHTGEKPYECGKCGETFSRRDLLTRHGRIAKHAVEGHKSVLRRPSHQQTIEDNYQLRSSEAGTISPDAQPQFPPVLQPQQAGAPPPTHPRRDPGEISALPESAWDPKTSFYDDDFDTFRDFVNFIDGAGLSAQWTPEFEFDWPATEGTDDRPSDPPGQVATPAVEDADEIGTPFSTWLPSAPANGHIVSPEASHELRDRLSDRPSYHVSEEQRSLMIASLSCFPQSTTSFQLPSRHALTRYLTAWFSGFHSHLPFIHEPTYKPSRSPVELTLAICSVGAQYCFERRNAEKLFTVAKSITLDRIRREERTLGPHVRPFLQNNHLAEPDPVRTPERCGPWAPLDLAQTLFALVGFATWERCDILHEAFALRGLLVSSLRGLGLTEDTHSTSVTTSKSATWDRWIRRESTRRTKLMVFCYLNVHSIAYDSHPMIWASEIQLRLPCLTQEWQARTAMQWFALQRDGRSEQVHLQQALTSLLQTDNANDKIEPMPSPLGNYVLLHALLQRIHLVRQLALPSTGTATIPTADIQSTCRGLRQWTSMWQQAPESMLDPNNENGPVPFTSSALLGIAYIRLSLNIGPFRGLQTRDPDTIAAGIGALPIIEHNESFHSALLYSTHSLSIPVRLGIDRVARSQAFFWSVQHALSSFECAIFLSKWLVSLSPGPDSRGLSGFERHIIYWVRCIVKEAYAVVDFEQVELSVPNHPYGLGLAVLRIWSRFLRSNTQWQFVEGLGLSLEKYMLSMCVSSPAPG